VRREVSREQWVVSRNGGNKGLKLGGNDGQSWKKKEFCTEEADSTEDTETRDLDGEEQRRKERAGQAPPLQG
jgi:hypothetical protein